MSETGHVFFYNISDKIYISQASYYKGWLNMYELENHGVPAVLAMCIFIVSSAICFGVGLKIFFL